MEKTKVKGFICVTLFEKTEKYISIDGIDSFEDYNISTLSEDYEVLETAEQIAQLINEARG